MNVKRGGVLLLLSIFLAFFTFTILVICYLYLRDMGRYFEIGRLNSTIAPMYEVYIKKSIPELVNNDIYFPQEGYNGKFFRLKYHELPFNGNFYCCIEKRGIDLTINGKKWDQLNDQEIQNIKQIIKKIEKNNDNLELEKEIYNEQDFNNFFVSNSQPDIERLNEGNEAKVKFGSKKVDLKVEVSKLKERGMDFEEMIGKMNTEERRSFIENEIKRYIEENYVEIAREYGMADYDYRDKLKEVKVEAKIKEINQISANEYEIYAKVDTTWKYRIRSKDVVIERSTMICYIVKPRYLISVSVFDNKNPKQKIQRVEVMGRGVIEIKRMECMY